MNKTTTVFLAALAVLILVSAACADRASITIYPGENWVSVPLFPFNSSPAAVFAGIDINGRLTRLDPLSGATVTYSSTNASAFRNILLGDGYKLTSLASTPVVVSYEGVPDGVPDAEGRMTDMWMALPGGGHHTGGVHWIGTPFDHATSVDACLVIYQGSILSLAQAVQQGWIDGLWGSMNNQSKSAVTVGLSSLSPDESVLMPGRMYQIVTHVDNLALIVPADVPEPSGLLGLVCGIGYAAGLIRRRP